MFDNISIFGYESSDPAARAAYDMCIWADEKAREEEEREEERTDERYPYSC